jgi:hypothetical protein
VENGVNNIKQSGMEAKVMKLAALADYQVGSVVSRTLLEKKTGTDFFRL